MAILKKISLELSSNTVTSDDCLISNGSLFHCFCPAAEYALLPYIFRLAMDSSSNWLFQEILMSGPQSIYLFIWMIDWFFYLVFLWSQSLTLENWPFQDNCWWMLEPGRDMVSKVQQCTIDKISKLHFPTRQYSSLNVIVG